MLSTEKMRFPSIHVWNIQWWQLLPCKTDIQFFCDLTQGVYPEEVKTLIPRNLDVVECSSFICKSKTGNIAALWVTTYTNSCVSTQQNIIQQWKETNYVWNNLNNYQWSCASWVGEGQYQKVTYSLSHLYNNLKSDKKYKFITYFFSCQGWWGTNE